MSKMLFFINRCKYEPLFPICFQPVPVATSTDTSVPFEDQRTVGGCHSERVAII